MIEQVAFLVLAGVTLGSAIGVVTSRSVFLSALWLIGSFIGVAGLYVLLGAGFLAMAQILVYVGAIAVLILFAIMLTRDVMVEQRPTGSQWVLGLSVAIALFGVLAVVGYGANWPVQDAAVPNGGGTVVLDGSLTDDQVAAIDGVVVEDREDGAQPVFTVQSSTASLGRAFMTSYLLPFEIIGALLLVAMVGAIVIARE